MRPQALMCTRLADMHVTHPLQVEDKCSDCGATVGIYPSGQDALKRWPKMKIICSMCAPGPIADLSIRPAASVERILQEMQDSQPVRKQ